MLITLSVLLILSYILNLHGFNIFLMLSTILHLPLDYSWIKVPIPHETAFLFYVYRKNKE